MRANTLGPLSFSCTPNCSCTVSTVSEKRSFLSSYMSMSATNQGLPVSQPDGEGGVYGLRRRLSSLSLKIQGGDHGAKSYWSSFPRSKSVSSMGEYAGTSVRKWWDWGWAWVLSRKPVFARDLELNEEESKVIGGNCKGSLKHVFYKIRSEIRKLIRSDHSSLPQTYRYDSMSYKKNFDDGFGIGNGNGGTANGRLFHGRF